ncbi:MAG: chorismate synthase [Phycisphaerales bacterium]|nr:chorismate synthase [Phycisphaerales bacterium]
MTYHSGMALLSYRTAGESHGPGVISLLEGLPRGVEVDAELIDSELVRRQGGYGRGGRQRIESDHAEFLGGVRLGRTTGAPVAILVPNKDSRLDDLERTPPVERPRPGHADLAGSIKWLTPDCRETLERASARETAGRTAMGALARCFLREIGIEIFGFVRGGGPDPEAMSSIEVTESNWKSLREARDASSVYMPDHDASERMIASIRQAKVDKDTVGGFVEVHVFGCPPGLGSCVQWDERLDSRIAGAIMGIQAFKAVEIGLGTECANRNGSQVHDPIHFDASKAESAHLGFTRPSNNAGGLEGGMTNGMPVVVRGTMKPISTLLRGLPSVNLVSRTPEESQYERSDISAIAAASVVAENVVALEITRAAREKFGGDSMAEVRSQFASYFELARALPKSD